MKIAKCIRFVLGAVALCAAVSLGAQGEEAKAPTDLESVVEQLDLTDEQREQVKGILQETREARRAILEKHGIDLQKGARPDRHAMSEARPELQASRKESDAKLAEVLDAEQLAKFKELRRQIGKKGLKKLKEKRKQKSNL
ncbi:hypothetical protein VDG1235_353 [Verrucomicrobiia bacterium DG1235]|nr:hypothetical protein VDG1235_353 [Verrucomicrobiae bacterium DG1235]